MNNIKTTLTRSFLFVVAVLSLVALGFGVHFSNAKVASAQSNGVYGEIRLNKNDGTHDYTLVIAGEGYTNGRFVSGSQVSVYVVGTYQNTTVKSLYINGEKENPSERIDLSNITSANRFFIGGYPTSTMPIYEGSVETSQTESRYLVHTLTVNGSVNISLQLAETQTIAVNGFVNNQKVDAITFNYYAYEGENLSTAITGAKICSIAENLTEYSGKSFSFNGFYEYSNNKYTFFHAQSINTSAPTQTSTFGAQLFEYKEISIATSTTSNTAGDVGGTATVSVANKICGEGAETTKYFPSVSDENNAETFLLYECRTEQNQGRITFDATPADGYVFLGWFNIGGTEAIYTQKTISYASLEKFAEKSFDENGIVARFAKKLEVSVSATSNITSISGMPSTFYYKQNVTLEPTLGSDTTFLGWYKNGTLLQTASALNFTATENCTLEARAAKSISCSIQIFGKASINNFAYETQLTAALQNKLVVKVTYNGNQTTAAATLQNGILSFVAPENATITLELSNLPYAISSINQITSQTKTQIFVAAVGEDQTELSANFILSSQSQIQINLTLPVETATFTRNTYLLNLTVLTSQNGQNVLAIGVSVDAKSGYLFQNASLNGVTFTNNSSNTNTYTIYANNLSTFFGDNANNYPPLGKILAALLTNNGVLESFNNKINIDQITLAYGATTDPSFAVTVAEINTISATAICGNGKIQTSQVGIISGGTLNSILNTTNNTELQIFAQNIIQVGGKTYIFSHFAQNGNYLAGRENANGQTFATSSFDEQDGFSLSFTTNGNAEISAVYCETTSVEITTITNDRAQGTPNIEITGFNGQEQFESTTLPIGQSVVFTVQNSQNFSHIELIQNGTTEIVSSLSVAFVVSEGTILRVVYKVPVSYPAVSSPLNTNATLAKAILVYNANGTYSFDSTNKFQVSSSSEQALYGESITLNATVENDYVFVGWLRVTKGASPTFPQSENSKFVSANQVFQTTASDNVCYVALFAQAISVEVVSNNGQNVTITDRTTLVVQSNHTYTYRGALLTFSCPETNFIGYYTLGNSSTILSENSTYNFVATASSQFACSYGTNNLLVRVATNNVSNVTTGGTFKATYSDGRTTLSNQASLNTTYATENGKFTTLEATENAGYRFLGWYVYNNGIGQLVSTDRIIKVERVSADQAYIACFAQAVNVTANIISGSGQIFGISNTLYVGYSTTISAVAQSGYTFKSLTINGEIQPSNTANIQSLPQNLEIEVEFESLPLTTVSSIGAATTIFINGVQATESYESNLNISVQYSSTEKFLYFVVNGVQTAATSNQNSTATLTLGDIAQNTSVVAVFAKYIPVTLNSTTTPSGNGGTAAILPALENGNAIAGETYTITAQPENGYLFTGISINGRFVPSSATSSSITITPTDNTELVVTAYFARAITLSVETNANGQILINGTAYSNGEAATVPYGKSAKIEYLAPNGYVLESASPAFSVAYSQTTGMLVANANTTITANFAEAISLTLQTNGNAQNTSITYNLHTGQELTVPKGQTATLSAAFESGNMVFAGFYTLSQNGALGNLVGTNYTLSNSVVSATLETTESQTIFARYQASNTDYIRSANNNTIQNAQNTLSKIQSVNVFVQNGTLTYFKDAVKTQNNIVSIVLPSALAVEIVANSTDFSGWYFAANTTGNFAYDYNNISTTNKFSFVPTTLAGHTSEYYLLATYNTNQIATDGSSKAEEPLQAVGGTATKNGTTYVATPNSGYTFVGWEVQIGASMSNMFITISAPSTITATANGDLLSITANATTYYSGFGIALRPLFVESSNPAAGAEQVTTHAIEIASPAAASITINGQVAKYAQIQNGTNVTLTATPAYIEISSTERLYFVGFYSNNTLLSAQNTYTFEATQSKYIEARYETRFAVTNNNSTTFVAEGSQVVATANQIVAGAQNNIQIFEGFNINSTFIPSSQTTISNGVVTFAVAINTATTIIPTYSNQKRITLSISAPSGSQTVVTTPNGTISGSQTVELVVTEAGVTLSTSAPNGLVFVGYKKTGNVLLSENEVFTVTKESIDSAQNVTAVFAQEAKVLLESNVPTTFTFNKKVAVGETVQITATVPANYTFVGWYGNNSSRLGTNTTLSYTFAQTNTIRAIFAPNYQIAVSATKNGNAEAIEIDCPQTASEGSTIILNAPVVQDAIFVGWYVNQQLVSSESQLKITVGGQTTVVAAYETTTQISLPEAQNVSYITSTGKTAHLQAGQQKSLTLSTTETATVLVSSSSVNTVLTQLTNGSSAAISNKTGVLTQAATNNISATEQSRNIKNVVLTSNIADVTLIGQKAYIIGEQAVVSFALPEDAASSTSTTKNRVLVFDGWYNNQTKVSTNASHSFAVSDSTVLEARFTEYFRVHTTSNGNGTITLSSAATNQGEFYPNGSTITATATADNNNCVLGITKNETTYRAGYLLEQEQQIEFVLGSATQITANFAQKITLTFNAVDINGQSIVGGLLSISSSTLPTATTTIEFNSSSVEVVVPKGANISVLFTPINGNSLLGVSNHELTNGALVLENVQQSTIINVNFVKSFTATAEAISTIGEQISPNPVTLSKHSNNIQAVAPLSIDNAKLIGFVLQLESGQKIKLSLDGNSVEKTSTTATLNTTINQNTVIYATYAQAVNVLATAQTTNQQTIENAISGLSETTYITDAVTLTANQVDGYKFIGWYKNGQFSSNNNTLAFVATSSCNIIALYAKIYTVNAQIVNGSFESFAVSGFVTGNNTSYYGVGNLITATPNNGYAFVGWYDANHELISSRNTLYSSEAQNPAFAVFKKVYTVTITTNVGGSIVGSLESPYGTYSALSTNKTVALSNLDNETTINFSALANTGYSVSQITINGQNVTISTENEYSAVINGQNLAIVVSFVKSFTVTYVAQDIVQGAAASVDNNSIATEYTKTYTGDSQNEDINITIPNGYGAEIRINNKVEKFTTTTGTKTITLNDNAKVVILFKQVVEITVGTDGNGNVTYTYEGTSITPDGNKIKVPAGEVFVASATPNTSYAFNGFYSSSEANATLLSSTINSLFMAENGLSIYAKFTLRTITVSIYFPADARGVGKTILNTSNPYPEMEIKDENGTVLYTINNTQEPIIENATAIANANIQKIEIIGDNIVLTIPYDYQKALTASFNRSTARANITYGNTIVCSSTQNGAADNKANIAINLGGTQSSPLTNNTQHTLVYSIFANISMTHDGNYANDHIELHYGSTDVFKTQNASSYLLQVMSRWVPVGNAIAISHTNNSSGQTESGIDLGFDNYLSLGRTVEDFDSNSIIANWKNGSGSRPTALEWKTILGDMAPSILNVSSGSNIILSQDLFIVADYLNLTASGSSAIFAVLANGLTNGEFKTILTNIITAQHANTTITYTIVPNSQSAQIAVTQGNNGSNFVQAGMAITAGNTQETIENSNEQNIDSGNETNTFVRLLAKYGTESSTITTDKTIKKANTPKPTDDLNGVTISKSTSTQSFDETVGTTTIEASQAPTGYNFLGYFIQNANGTYSSVNSTNQTATIQRIGSFEAVALFERNLYLIQTNQYAANKTDSNGEFALNGQNYTVVNEGGALVVKDKNGSTISTSALQIVNILPVPSENPEFYIVYTSESSNSGKITGSLVYEHNETAKINAYTRIYGEFAGYEFTNEAPTEATLTTTNNISRTFAPGSSIIEPYRNANTLVANNKQELSFVVTNSSTISTYFTSLRYKVTIEFAEFLNEAKEMSDFRVLFGITGNENISSTDKELDSRFKTLSNTSNYINQAGTSFNSGIIGVTLDTGEELELAPLYDSEKGTISTSFFIDAKVGSGFSGFKINYNAKSILGKHFIIAPSATNFTYQQSSTKGEASNYYSCNYNNDLEGNEDGSSNSDQIKNVTIYLATKRNLQSAKINNSSKDGTTQRVTVNTNKQLQLEKGESGDTTNINTTNGATTIIIKDAYKYYNQITAANGTELIENYLRASSTYNPFVNVNLDLFIEKTYKTHFQSQNQAYVKNIFQLAALHTNILQIPTTMVKIGELSGVQQLTDSSTISALMSDPNRSIVMQKQISTNPVQYEDAQTLSTAKKIKLSNGRYLYFSEISNEGILQTQTSAVDYNKYKDYNISYNNSTGLVTLTKNNQTETYPLILSVNMPIGTLNDISQTIEVEIYMVNTNGNNTIYGSQDDMVIATSYQTSIYQQQQNLQESGWSGFFLGNSLVRARRPYSYYLDTTFTFTGATQQDNTEYLGVMSGNSNTILNGPENVVTIWDIIYNNNFDRSVIGGNSIDVTTYGASPSHILPLHAMVVFDGHSEKTEGGNGGITLTATINDVNNEIMFKEYAYDNNQPPLEEWKNMSVGQWFATAGIFVGTQLVLNAIPGIGTVVSLVANPIIGSMVTSLYANYAVSQNDQEYIANQPQMPALFKLKALMYAIEQATT